MTGAALAGLLAVVALIGAGVAAVVVAVVRRDGWHGWWHFWTEGESNTDSGMIHPSTEEDGMARRGKQEQWGAGSRSKNQARVETRAKRSTKRAQAKAAARHEDRAA